MNTNLNYLRKFNSSAFPHIMNHDSRLTNTSHVVLSDTIIEPDNWDLFWELWNNLKEPMNDERNRETAIWETLGIYKNPSIEYSQIVEPSFSYPLTDWSSMFPKMFDAVMNVMPFNLITHITLCSSIKPVIPHVDPILSFYPWPNCLRVMLYDENTDPTFYLTKWPEKYLETQIQSRPFSFKERYISFKDIEDKIYVELPENSNTFVFSNGEFLHGADYHGKTKIMMLVHGDPNHVEWKKRLYGEL